MGHDPGFVANSYIADTASAELYAFDAGFSCNPMLPRLQQSMAEKDFFVAPCWTAHDLRLQVIPRH